MYLHNWIALLLSIIAVANCYLTLGEIYQVNGDDGLHRDSKRLNGPITRQRSKTKEATSRQSIMRCAALTENYEGGDVTIMDDGGLFFSPKPSTQRKGISNQRKQQRQRQRQENAPKGRIYTAELCPRKSVVQIKLNIINMDLKAPMNGKCTDKLEITGANAALKIPELCGKVTNQTLYIHIDNSDGPYEIKVKTLDFSEVEENDSTSMPSSSGSNETNIGPFWIINISFLNRDKAVPRGCLQYQWTSNGTLQSLNFGGQASLINQRYAICFAYVLGHCDIMFNFTRFDLGETNGDCKDDYLLIGDNKHCGDVNNTIIIADSSGPIFVNVRMDGNNTDQDKGFSGTYSRIPCDKNKYLTTSNTTTMSSDTPTTTSSPPSTTSELSTTMPELPKTTDDSLNFFWL